MTRDDDEDDDDDNAFALFVKLCRLTTTAENGKKPS